MTLDLDLGVRPTFKKLKLGLYLMSCYLHVYSLNILHMDTSYQDL